MARFAEDIDTAEFSAAAARNGIEFNAELVGRLTLTGEPTR